MALSAFGSFCDGAARGAFPRLGDRDDLWRLLIVLTARKAVDRLRHDARARRGGGRVLDEVMLDGDSALERVIGREPTPEFTAMVAEEFRLRLESLGDETLRRVAQWKLEGATGAEIAARLGCARRTVARKLEVIRTLWSPEQEPS